LTDADKARAEEHKAALEYFFANLSVTNAIDENEKGAVKKLIRQMMGAVGAKYSVHEIVWKPQPDGNLTAEFRWTPLWFFENLTGKLRYLTMEGETYGDDLEEAGWMITVGDGLMYALLIAHMFKKLPLSDWVTFCERSGMPAFLGKTSAPIGSAQWEAMMEMLESLASDFAGLMNQADSVEVLDLKGSQAALPYEPLVDRMDRAIVALCRGGDLSTMSSGKGSQGHGSQRQDQEADCLLEDDVEMIDETMHQWVTKYVIEYQFGDDRPLARYKTVVPPAEATAQDIAVDQFLSGVAPEGQGLGWDAALKRYGRVAAKPGEPILVAPKQPEQIPNNLGNIRLGNVRSSAQDKAINSMLASAHTMLTRAQAQALAPLHRRIDSALKVPDAQLANEINRVLAELPEMLKHMNLNPPTARILENAYTAALMDGLTAPTPENRK
jgi:phage gp29-like protein